jgi:hypothetical protein
MFIFSPKVIGFVIFPISLVLATICWIMWSIPPLIPSPTTPSQEDQSRDSPQVLKENVKDNVISEKGDDTNGEETTISTSYSLEDLDL